MRKKTQLANILFLFKSKKQIKKQISDKKIKSKKQNIKQEYQK